MASNKCKLVSENDFTSLDYNDQSDEDVNEDSQDYEDFESMDFGSDFDFDFEDGEVLAGPIIGGTPSVM